MKLLSSFFYWCLFIITALPASAQVSVSPLSGGSVTVSDMVSQLTFGSSSVTTSNAVFTGANVAAGTFTGGNDALGFSSGIFLSTGLATNLIGSLYPSTQNGQAGSPTYFSGTTYDAAVLYFSFIPTGDRISFRFRFISAESFGGEYSDAFGIFVNGSTTTANVALLPNGNPVTVTNISSEGPYFENGSTLGLNDYYKTPPRGSSIILQADATVTPDQVNTIAFAIADAGDSRVDSVVIVGAGTFYSNSTPQVLNSISDQQVRVKSVLNFVLPSNTFYDADSGDLLAISASLGSGTTLPEWLSFNPATGVLSGSPSASDVGDLVIKVKATDSKGASTSDEFTLSVLPELPSGNTLFGRVIDSQGAGVVNAIVYVRDTADGAVRGSALTTTSGSFSFGGVKTEKRYALSTSRTGYIFSPAEALPGIERIITGANTTFIKSVCTSLEQSIGIHKIHSQATEICSLSVGALEKVTNVRVAKKIAAASKRVQTSLDALTVVTDNLPEVFLKCPVKDLCTMIKMGSSLKRLASSLTRLQKGSLIATDLATNATTGRAKIPGKAAARAAKRLYSQAMKAIRRIPASNYQCS